MNKDMKKIKSDIESRFSKMNKISKKNSIVFFGSNYFSEYPFNELLDFFNMEEKIFNRSVKNKSIDKLCDMTDECIFELNPKKIFINVGEVDISENDFNEKDFKMKYE